MDYEIDDLRRRPEFCRPIAERIWSAWWREAGTPFAELLGMVEACLDPAGTIPFALVAHRGDVFLGTASVISNDLAERPNLSPWIAAVWVDADHRGQGVAAALTRTAAKAAFALGPETLYLNATPANAGLYEGLGWRRIESDVGGVHILQLKRQGRAADPDP